MILTHYTEKLNPWPPKHERTGTDFMKYYPVEGKFKFPFRTKEFIEKDNYI